MVCGYIEKDWGYSFPKSYIWCQANNFQKSNTSFMLSIADIPFKLFDFRGIICALIIDNKEYKFTTYNNTKIIGYNITNKYIDITLKKCNYYLYVRANYDKKYRLYAPVMGKMNKEIFESVLSNIIIALRKNNQLIFLDSSINCGLEIVQ